MTEEAHQLENDGPVKTLLSTENQAGTEAIKTKVDNKKEKCRPMTKVVIRRLPPTMSQTQFIEQVSPLPDHDYLYFVKADMSLGQNAFSRAYINFLEQQDIFVFREKFDNYVFVDAKGTEYPAVVEFSPFQRLPKKKNSKKKDPKCGTIGTDPYYTSFLESLKNQETESGTAQPKTEYSYQPFDNAAKRVTTTPLLEYLKQRKAEKQRVRDEKREERRKRDLERRRTKEEPTISKVLKNPDMERDNSKENRDNKDDRERILPIKEQKNRKKDESKPRDKTSVTRERESKSTGKSYRDRDERKLERENKQKKYEEKKLHKRDEKDERIKNREDRKESKEDQKEKFFEEKKGKSYEKMRQEKRQRLTEVKKQGVPDDNTEIPRDITPNKREFIEKKKILVNENNEIKPKEVVIGITTTEIPSEQNRNDCSKKVVPDGSDMVSNSCQETSVGSRTDKITKIFNDNLDDTLDSIKIAKISKRRSSLESGGEGGGGDGGHLRRHKSLDGGDDCDLQKSPHDDKDKAKKDKRKERRIRNKDRPAMEIYRPGMGRFSKQRLEREKSTHDDRASLSQSPTPTGKPSSSSTAKPNEAATVTLSAAELRSMTFKRSVSRDTS